MTNDELLEEINRQRKRVDSLVQVVNILYDNIHTRNYDLKNTPAPPQPRPPYFPWWVYNIMGLVFIVGSAFPGIDMGWRVVCSVCAFWCGLSTGIKLVKRNRGLK